MVLIGGSFYNSFGFSWLLVIQWNLLLYIQKIIPTKQIKTQPNKRYVTDASSSWKGYLEEKVISFLLFCIDIHECSREVAHTSTILTRQVSYYKPTEC